MQPALISHFFKKNADSKPPWSPDTLASLAKTTPITTPINTPITASKPAKPTKPTKPAKPAKQVDLAKRSPRCMSTARFSAKKRQPRKKAQNIAAYQEISNSARNPKPGEMHTRWDADYKLHTEYMRVMQNVHWANQLRYLDWLEKKNEAVEWD